MLTSRDLKGHFQVETAPDGAAALRQLQELGPCAVVVSDMDMPGMIGLELLREVERAQADTVRILIADNSDQSTAVAAVKLGHVFVEDVATMSGMLTVPAGAVVTLAVLEKLRNFAEPERVRSPLVVAGPARSGSIRTKEPLFFSPPSPVRVRCDRGAVALRRAGVSCAPAPIFPPRSVPFPCRYFHRQPH